MKALRTLIFQKLLYVYKNKRQIDQKQKFSKVLRENNAQAVKTITYSLNIEISSNAISLNNYFDMEALINVSNYQVEQKVTKRQPLKIRLCFSKTSFFKFKKTLAIK